MSGGELSQITSDHSLVEDLLRAGKITEEEARDHPHRNVVTRVLGLSEDPEVDTFELAVRDGDLLLLASDGLFNEVDHHMLATILDNAVDLDEAAERLVERANQNGGHDNITVVVARILDEDPVVSAPASAAAIASLEPVDSDGPRTLAVDANTEDGSDSDLELSTPGRETIDPPTEEIPTVRRPRVSRMRAFVFVVCLLALLGLAIGGFVAYATNAWFVDTVANEVVIHQGRPGGVLFIEPQAVQSTGIDINELNPASRDRVNDTPLFSSLDDAEQFVANLELSTVRTNDSSE